MRIVGHMTVANEHATSAGGGWRKLCALLLALAAVGLPVNDLGTYMLLLLAVVVIFTGEVSARVGAWATAVVIIAVVAAAQFLLAPPRPCCSAAPDLSRSIIGNGRVSPRSVQDSFRFFRCRCTTGISAMFS